MGRLDWAGLRVLGGHGVWERPAQYESAGHMEQVWLNTDRFPTNPAKHTQSPLSSPPVVAVVLLGGQSVQMLAPLPVMNVPARQAVHAALDGMPVPV